jgi:hypothetical protein
MRKRFSRGKALRRKRFRGSSPIKEKKRERFKKNPKFFFTEQRAQE